jgi:hypothetical protein
VHVVQVQRVQAQIPPRAIPAVIIPRGARVCAAFRGERPVGLGKTR